MASVNPYCSKLHAGNAYWMARLAHAAYIKRSDSDPAPDEQAILADLKAEDGGFLSVFGCGKDSAQAILVEHQNYLCISCRGTDEFNDWLDNINVVSEAHLFGEFHRGFWRSVEDIWLPLAQQLQVLQQQNKQSQKNYRPLFLTGHSLGGAMATIIAAKFVHQDRPFTSLYSFGQPRAMTRATSRIFNAECGERVFRFHNNNDIVTRVPARAMGYSHAGCYLYISQEMQIHREPSYWFRYLDAIDGAVNALKEQGFDSIADHSMAKYLAAVTRWDYQH